MKSIYHNEPAPENARIALRPREAALQLGLSEKTLWSNSAPHGTIPCVRLGSRVLYFRHQLERWADEQLAHQQQVSQQQPATQETQQ